MLREAYFEVYQSMKRGQSMRYTLAPANSRKALCMRAASSFVR
jgi:hypothetical protein